MARAVTVLLTSAGRRVELVRAFQAAARRLGIEARVLATDINPLAPALHVADGAFLVPPTRDAAFVPALVGICEQERVSLVLPLIDPDIPVLARQREDFRAAGAAAGVVSADAAEVTRDKVAHQDVLRRTGLPVARGWTADDIDPAAVPYPVFVKPPATGAPDSTRSWPARGAELSFFLGYVPSPMVEEHCRGPEGHDRRGVRLDGRLRGLVLRKRLEVMRRPGGEGGDRAGRAHLTAAAASPRPGRGAGAADGAAHAARRHRHLHRDRTPLGGGRRRHRGGVDGPASASARSAGHRPEPGPPGRPAKGST